MFKRCSASWAPLCLFLLALQIDASSAAGGPSTCSAFVLDDLPDVELSATTYYAANTSVNIMNFFTSIDVDDLPAFCRVELVITTNSTAKSSCRTEVWLPDAWNGRFLGIGNGGLAGGVNVAELGYIAVAQGFAGVSTNTGHTSTTSNGTWGGPHNDNAIVDWGWRAMHLSVVKGKEVVKQYYGEAQNKSYYMGCSTGGRQGLKEVQEFPEDFDGAVVGSPANWQTHLQDWAVHMNLDVLPSNGSHFIDSSLWINIIHPEVLRQCDWIDGLTDGIINDPRFCDFRPETLTCRPGQDTASCLTLPQIEAVHRIYSDYYEANQTWIFGRYYPGGETEWPHGYLGPEPFTLAENWFRYFVLNDTEWTIYQSNASLIGLADEVDPGQANAIDRNLTAFAGPEHNGKLLQYVGWADQLISPGNSIHYYESVYAFMEANTDLDVDDFYRLFTVPGMNHCDGGFGANAFGAVQQASNDMPPLSLAPENNILAAMVQWVEEGIAPSSLTAAYYNNNNVTDGIGFVRPLCQYPKSLRYNGGNQTSPEGFTCV